MRDFAGANRRAVRRMMAARPLLVGVTNAGESIPGMHSGRLLHAGPPIDWEQASGPLRGAIIGALLLEGRAASADEATRLMERGEIELEPCHHHGVVGPMAGVVSVSMAVYVVEDADGDGRAFSTLNEGYGKVLRYGAYAPDVLDKLAWMNSEMARVLAASLEENGPLDLRTLLAEALHMGDEGHNRNKSGSLLFLRSLAPTIARVAGGATASQVIEFLAANALSVLNPVMAACKLMADRAHGVAGSSVVSTMARNGTEFGIRVSGLGDRWFTAPAPVPDGLYFAGFDSTRRQPGHRRLDDYRDRRHRRLRDGCRARHRHLHRRHGPGGARRDTRDVRDHRRRARPLHHSGPRLSRHAGRNRPSQGGRARHHAAHQYRHRPP